MHQNSVGRSPYSRCTPRRHAARVRNICLTKLMLYNFLLIVSNAACTCRDKLLFLTSISWRRKKDIHPTCESVHWDMVSFPTLVFLTPFSVSGEPRFLVVIRIKSSNNSFSQLLPSCHFNTYDPRTEQERRLWTNWAGHERTEQVERTVNLRRSTNGVTHEWIERVERTELATAHERRLWILEKMNWADQRSLSRMKQTNDNCEYWRDELSGQTTTVNIGEDEHARQEKGKKHDGRKLGKKRENVKVF